MNKETLAQFLNHYLSLATIIGIAFIALWILGMIVTNYSKKECKISMFVSKYPLPIGFFLSLGGVIMSLFYSEYLNYAPCELCWFQRVFLYPQVLLFGLAWYNKDKNILPYSLILSIVGIIIAVYHHLLQIGYNIYQPCSTAPFAVDCSTPSFMEFGFVTFPLMSAVLFGFLILVVFVSNKFTKPN